MYTSWLALGISLLGAALATPTERKPPVHCNIISLNGAQYLYLHSSTKNPTSLPGIQSNYHLSDALAAIGSHANPGNNPMVLINSQPFQGDNFGFEACTSTYMKFPSSDTVGGHNRWYGHIRAYGDPYNPNAPALCLTRRWIEPGHEFLTAEACSYADNSSQETQYFAIVEVATGYEIADYSLEMIGAPKGQHSKKYYFAPGTSAAPAITVHPDQDTGHKLGIEYIHYN
ncbi:hypothetical protein BS47DRAFT_566445 [Hydnum rufescens UP504]|uniref:Uncharacterized protein n=1 Tax=Hydnum rufescens UP504 TaxID=1448309 RepID=A0A9P6DX47_9AGAM|nr:hypothetical protein BS47DRAFT_566445 [Hydnum rufescens UP504]